MVLEYRTVVETAVTSTRRQGSSHASCALKYSRDGTGHTQRKAKYFVCAEEIFCSAFVHLLCTPLSVLKREHIIIFTRAASRRTSSTRLLRCPTWTGVRFRPPRVRVATRTSRTRPCFAKHATCHAISAAANARFSCFSFPLQLLESRIVAEVSGFRLPPKLRLFPRLTNRFLPLHGVTPTTTSTPDRRRGVRGP